MDKDWSPNKLDRRKLKPVNEERSWLDEIVGEKGLAFRLMKFRTRTL